MLNGLILMTLLAAAAGSMWLVSKAFPGKDRPIHFVAIGVIVAGLIGGMALLGGDASSPSSDRESEDDYSWARR